MTAAERFCAAREAKRTAKRRATWRRYNRKEHRRAAMLAYQRRPDVKHRRKMVDAGLLPRGTRGRHR